MRTFDGNYANWKVGDKVVWASSPHMESPVTISMIDKQQCVISYEYGNGKKGTARWATVMRVTEDDTTAMTDLEKLITDLCELPAHLVGAGAAEVHYAVYESEQPFVVLENWRCDICLDPIQALALLSWLTAQHQNLEQLRDALQAKHVQDQALRERLTALKVKHSEAVTAWQEGGCVGPCPSFEATR